MASAGDWVSRCKDASRFFHVRAEVVHELEKGNQVLGILERPGIALDLEPTQLGLGFDKC